MTRRHRQASTWPDTSGTPHRTQVLGTPTARCVIERVYASVRVGMQTTMTTQQPTPRPDKDPEDWVTGDEPMTGPQNSYLHTLAQEAGQNVSDDLTKAEASEEIERLQHETGRGTSG